MADGPPALPCMPAAVARRPRPGQRLGRRRLGWRPARARAGGARRGGSGLGAGWCGWWLWLRRSGG
eukprot:11023102-Lingulodinium_polyedra.AAC.1